MNQRTSFSK